MCLKVHGKKRCLRGHNFFQTQLVSLILKFPPLQTHAHVCTHTYHINTCTRIHSVYRRQGKTRRILWKANKRKTQIQKEKEKYMLKGSHTKDKKEIQSMENKVVFTSIKRKYSKGEKTSNRIAVLEYHFLSSPKVQFADQLLLSLSSVWLFLCFCHHF